MVRISGRPCAKSTFRRRSLNVDIDDVRHGVQYKLPDLLDNRGAGNGLPRPRTARMRAESLAKTKGFATQSSAPASRPRTRSSTFAAAVTMSTGRPGFLERI